MPTNNFVQFNQSKTNMMDDSTYTQQAPQGIVGGGTIADSTLHNKLFYQLSTMASSIAKTIEDNGFDVSDENIDTLVDSLKNSFKKSVYDSMTSTNTDRTHKIPELDILFNRPPVGVNNVALGYNQGGYIIFGKPYGGYAIQHGYTYVDTVGYVNKIATVTVTFPIAFTELYGINLTYRDSALSTNNLERTIYFVSSAGSYSSGSTTSFVLANHSEYASGYNTYWWTAFGKI